MSVCCFALDMSDIDNFFGLLSIPSRTDDKGSPLPKKIKHNKEKISHFIREYYRAIECCFFCLLISIQHRNFHFLYNFLSYCSIAATHF